MSINLTSIKERVAISGLEPVKFTPEERDLIIKAINLYSDIHRAERGYPSRHGPGSSPWATIAWTILDNIPERAMSRDMRNLLAGMIAGALNETDKMAHETKH